MAFVPILTVPAEFPLLEIEDTDLKTLVPTACEMFAPVIVSVWYCPSWSYPMTVKLNPESFAELVIVTYPSMSFEFAKEPSKVRLPESEVASLFINNPSASVYCFL